MARSRTFTNLLRALLPLLLAGGAWAAPGMVTLIEGDATVVHPKGSMAVVEALKLPAAALVQTGPNTRLLRVEWADGSALDLGPSSQAMLLGERMSDRASKTPGVYLLRGWAKLSSAQAATAPLLWTSFADLPPAAGVLVLQAQADRLQLFVEAGGQQLQERGAKAPIALAAGQYYGRQGSDKGVVQPRPPADLFAQMPRAFRDTLPKRWAALQQRNVVAKPLPLPAYPELRDWLGADATFRRLLVTQFSAWAQEPGLRSSLIIRINEHREWAPLVMPKPDPASGASR